MMQVKAIDETPPGVLATFPSLSQPWEYQGGILVPDPGIPIVDYASQASWLWRTQPSVRKVVDYIARNIASIPLHVYERIADTERQRLNTDPLEALLRNPALYVGQYHLIHDIIVDLMLWDRWLLWQQPSADTESGWTLLRIPPERFRLVDDGWGRAVGAIVVRPDGTSVPLGADQVIWDYGYGGANGIPPSETLRDILAENVEAVKYRRSVWKNQARVPTVIERPAEAPAWDDGKFRRFQNSWRNFVDGGMQGGTPILEDGMKLAKVDGFSPKDAQDLEGRQLTDQEVASAFHIPPELVGAREGNYSNVDAFRQSLYRDALGPAIIQLEQALNAMLTPRFATGRSLYIEANVDVKLRASFEEDAAVTSTATGGPWMTRNEARARRNMPPIDGGDELIVPLAVTEGGLASPRDTAGDTNA